MDELIQPVKSPFASNTSPADKNQWMTPPEIFAALDAEFGFYLDAAATFESTLCPLAVISGQCPFLRLEKLWRCLVQSTL